MTKGMMKRKTIAGLIAVVSVIAVAMFAGCVEEEEPTPTPMSATPVPTQKTVVATPTPTFVLTYQDSEYRDWVVGTAHILTADMDLISSAYNRYDLESVELYSGTLKDDAGQALNEIDRFDVSPKLKQSKNEFTQALADYTMAGYYGEFGAKYLNSADIETSAEYIESATTHIETATALLEGYY